MYLTEGYNIYSEFPELLTHLGLAMVQVGNYEGAMTKLSKSIELDQSQYRAYNTVGNIYKM